MHIGTVYEVWSRNWSEQTVVKVWSRNWSEQTVSGIWNMSLSKKIDDIWQVHTSQCNSMHESSRSRESNVFIYMSQYMYDMSYCIIITSLQ